MKVSSSPFEAPHETAVPDAADRVRLRQAQSESDSMTEAAAINEVKSEIDPATRESLGRLASLIRSQLKASEAAAEAVQEEARIEQEEAAAIESRQQRALKIAESGEDEALLRERVAKTAYPTVERIEKRFQEENRRRGVQIYTKQKTKDAVQQILAALEDPDAPRSDAFDDEAA